METRYLVGSERRDEPESRVSGTDWKPEAANQIRSCTRRRKGRRNPGNVTGFGERSANHENETNSRDTSAGARAFLDSILGHLDRHPRQAAPATISYNVSARRRESSGESPRLLQWLHAARLSRSCASIHTKPTVLRHHQQSLQTGAHPHLGSTRRRAHHWRAEGQTGPHHVFKDSEADGERRRTARYGASWQASRCLTYPLAGKLDLVIPPFVQVDHDTAARRIALTIEDKTIKQQKEMWGQFA